MSANKQDHSGTANNRRRHVIVVAVVCCAVVATALWLKLGCRGTEPAVPDGNRGKPGYMTVEEARAKTQKLVSERMADPVYRAELNAIVEERRVLATEANDLQDEINVWQAGLARTNEIFAVHLAQLAALQQAGTNATAEMLVAISAHEKALQEIMAGDPHGQALQARQDDIQARRDALQKKAHATVRARMQQQMKQSGKTNKESAP